MCVINVPPITHTIYTYIHIHVGVGVGVIGTTFQSMKNEPYHCHGEKDHASVMRKRTIPLSYENGSCLCHGKGGHLSALGKQSYLSHVKMDYDSILS